jgi:predicted nucleic acid-binding protein
VSTKVVDASAVLAVLLDEPEANKVTPLMDSHELAAPLLIVFEVLSTCSVKALSFPEKRAIFAEALHKFVRLEIGLHEIDPKEVFDLALDHKLTGYDASYLWLAKKMSAELVTLDRQLARADSAR